MSQSQHHNIGCSHQAASTDLKQLGFSVATRGMESAVEDLSQLLNANSQLVESDDRLSLFLFCTSEKGSNAATMYVIS